MLRAVCCGWSALCCWTALWDYVVLLERLHRSTLGCLNFIGLLLWHGLVVRFMLLRLDWCTASEWLHTGVGAWTGGYASCGGG